MSDTLAVTILGCGSSGGVPRIGNDWGACDPLNPKNRRLRCSLLVERTSTSGKTTVLIDTGPDLRQQMLEHEVQNVDAVLYTHAHADHLHGIDDLRMFAIRYRRKVPVYMDEATHVRAQSAFGYCFTTPAGSSYPPILERILLADQKTVTIVGEGGPIGFLPIEVQHGDIKSLGFRFENIAYLPDVSDIPLSARGGFEDLDVWILDCLRSDPHPSHFNLADALAWADDLKPRQTILTDLHNDLDYEQLRSKLPKSVIPAYDGMVLTRTL
ncbi:MBL fold metallo-hydrolase [uncultured Roseibium sp.]|uniref:MBL fold metallo-hydrolase n=1 Tax=uncultured Roseibium sp. TaxID=1936171 RepID=UPI00259498AB|nr:MBL fold metallo-hydrolase [uncultured Roseibium sp.]